MMADARDTVNGGAEAIVGSQDSQLTVEYSLESSPGLDDHTKAKENDKVDQEEDMDLDQNQTGAEQEGSIADPEREEERNCEAQVQVGNEPTEKKDSLDTTGSCKPESQTEKVIKNDNRDTSETVSGAVGLIDVDMDDENAASHSQATMNDPEDNGAQEPSNETEKAGIQVPQRESLGKEKEDEGMEFEDSVPTGTPGPDQVNTIPGPDQINSTPGENIPNSEEIKFKDSGQTELPPGQHRGYTDDTPRLNNPGQIGTPAAQKPDETKDTATISRPGSERKNIDEAGQTRPPAASDPDEANKTPAGENTSNVKEANMNDAEDNGAQESSNESKKAGVQVPQRESDEGMEINTTPGPDQINSTPGENIPNSEEIKFEDSGLTELPSGQDQGHTDDTPRVNNPELQEVKLEETGQIGTPAAQEPDETKDTDTMSKPGSERKNNDEAGQTRPPAASDPDEANKTPAGENRSNVQESPQQSIPPSQHDEVESRKPDNSSSSSAATAYPKPILRSNKKGDKGSDSSSSEDDDDWRRPWASRDTEMYRRGYPGKRDNPNFNSNYKFYTNQICSQPDGDFIDCIHEKWRGEYYHLEVHHGYIQWLFPIRESGMNWSAQELQLHEIKRICADKEAHRRVLTSYEMMLDFYGMKLKDRETGELERAANWRDRFQHLNHSMHNYLRITRILKCLGEFDYEHLKAPFVRFVLREAIVEKTLKNTKNSCLNYWLEVIKDDKERKKIRRFAKELTEKKSQKN